MAKDCLYCGLQFSDTTNFCPNCGRPTERDLIIRPNQESELDRLRKEIQEKVGQMLSLLSYPPAHPLRRVCRANSFPLKVAPD